MTTPKVSVLMTVYSQPYLRQAMDSVLSQTFSDFEFVVIDDCSPDNSWQILQEYAARDERVVLRRNERNLGQTGSLNVGLTLVRGEYIARQDEDDLSAPERLARQVAYLDAHPEAAVVGTVTHLIDSGDAVVAENYLGDLTETEAVEKQLLEHFCIAHGSVMMRRAHLDQVGNYDERLALAEDNDLWLRLAEVGRVSNLPEPLYLYRVHAASAGRKRHGLQMQRLAQGIENAIRRRHGAAPASEVWLPAARAYVRAAIIAAASDDLEAARDRLAHAQILYPAVFEADDPLGELLAFYTAGWLVETGLNVYQVLFNCLPPDRHLARLKARLVSALHMREVFAAAQGRESQRPEAHLWPAVRADPGWLLNRGVLSLTARALLHRAPFAGNARR